MPALDPTTVPCRYCGKQCLTEVELARHWYDNGVRVTCCNKCGGYETCPRCGQLWENLSYPAGCICPECEEKR